MIGLSSPYIAVVDDDESQCRSLGRLLRAEGMHAITYLSAEAFLADTMRPQFSCLILDIRLGGMSGLDLARKLVKEGPLTPFLLVTAHDSPAMRSSAEAAGCHGFLAKTKAGSDVIAAIRRITDSTTR